MITMKKISTTNNVRCSNGVRIRRITADGKIREVKAEKIRLFREQHGYIFCEDCKRSGGMYFDCSHIIPVKECYESGRAELAWDVKNIKILCRECHQKKDKLNIQSGKI